MSLAAKAVLAALLQSAGAVRRGYARNTKVAGVPMMNYRYRHMQDSVAAQGAEPGVYDWVLKFKDGLSDKELDETCEGHCVAMGHPSHGGIPLATVRMTEKNLEQLLERHQGLVEFVEPDTPVELEPALEENPEETSLWSHERVNKAGASFTGKGTHIYVMDTGVRTSHQDFGGRALPTVDTVANGGAVTECNGDADCARDDNGHGTHCAGTAGGNTYGLATDAILYAMKVCCGSGSNVYGGMDWIVQNARKPAVMTMSLGSYSTPEASRVATDAVVNSGVTVIVSAGNRGTESCLKSYTFIASALGVGCANQTDQREQNSRWGSNWGPCNAIFAPGVSIVSASKDSDTGSSVKSGTSMAAPLVAGGAALLLEENPGLTPAEIRDTLRARATKDALRSLKPGDPNLLLNVGY